MPSSVIAPGILTLAQIMFLLREVGFPEEVVPKMLAIAKAENPTLNTSIVNNTPETGDLSYGLFQINMKGDLGPARREMFGIKSNEELFDPLTNAKAAYAVWKEASGFKKNKGDGLNAWSTYGEKEYNDFLSEAEKLATRTKPTSIPARSKLREEIKNNVLNGGGGMSKPVSRKVSAESALDNIPKIPVGGKEYTLGAAQDLFVKGDEKTKNEILTFVQAYNPTGNYKNPNTINTAWNAIVTNYASANSVAKKPFITWFNDQAEYFKNLQGVGDGTSTLLQPSITSKQEAYDDFNTFILESTGLNANPKDAEQYYKKLRQLEKTKVAKQVTTKTGTTTTQVVTGGITKEDREALAASFIPKYIDIKGVQNIGGAVGSNLATLRKLASDYNVVLSDAEIRKYAVDALTNKNVLDNAQLKIKNTAKVRYQNLGNFIDQGLTVRDIASQYINTMARVLEVNPDTIQLDNKYIDNALSTFANFTDFNKMLRNSPEWQYTDNARSEAAGYANKILQDFGLR
jgi:hypothetical protein